MVADLLIQLEYMKTKLAFFLIMSALVTYVSVTNNGNAITVSDVEALTLVERRIPRVQTSSEDWQNGFRKVSDVSFTTQEEFTREGYWYWGINGYCYYPTHTYIDDVVYYLDCCMSYVIGQECNFATDPDQCDNVSGYRYPTQLY